MSRNLAVAKYLEDKIKYYDSEKDHNAMEVSLKAVINTAKVIESWITNRDEFLGRVRHSSEYSDMVEYAIKELKNFVDEVDMAFCGIALWAHEARKGDKIDNLK